MTDIGYSNYNVGSGTILKNRLQREWYGLLHDSHGELSTTPHPSVLYPVVTMHAKNVDGRFESIYLLTAPIEQWQSWLTYYLHCCFAELQRLSRGDYYLTTKFLREFHHDSALLLAALRVELEDEDVLIGARELIDQAQHTMKCHLSLPEYAPDTHTDILAVFSHAKLSIFDSTTSFTTVDQYLERYRVI